MAQFSLLAMLSLYFSSCLWLCSPSDPQQAVFLTLPRSRRVLTSFCLHPGKGQCLLSPSFGRDRCSSQGWVVALFPEMAPRPSSPLLHSLCGPVSKSGKPFWRDVSAQHDAGMLTRGSFSPFLVNPPASQPHATDPHFTDSLQPAMPMCVFPDLHHLVYYCCPATHRARMLNEML